MKYYVTADIHGFYAELHKALKEVGYFTDAEYEGKSSEFGPDADFSPYYGPGVIALDACTAHSGRINILTLED